MSRDLEREPDFSGLFVALLEKTRAGKMVWKPTAHDDVFVSGIEGQRVFEICRAVPNTDIMKLVVRDGSSMPIFATPEASSVHGVELFELARRVATQLDVKVAETLRIVSEL